MEYSGKKYIKQEDIMEIILENNILALTVNTLGAELVSVQKKRNGRGAFMGCARGRMGIGIVILFPWCGRLKNGKFTYNGTEYEGAGHGFARDLEHTVTEQTDTSITLTLAANAVTMEKYPFVFCLVTTYTLQGTAVRHDVRVENEGDWDMPFALGFHPGFMLRLTASIKPRIMSCVLIHRKPLLWWIRAMAALCRAIRN